MTLAELQLRAIQVADTYSTKNKTDGHTTWDASAYMAGFVGDVGDLSKLVMARSGYRNINNADAKIAHELGDCLWSLLVLADRLDVDIESAFTGTMSELDERLAK